MIQRVISVIVIMISCIFCTSIVASADAMDPLKDYDVNSTTAAGEGTMSAPTPTESTSDESTADSAEEDVEDLTLDDYMSQRRTSRLAQFMDSCMWMIGGIALVLPVLYLGIFLIARVHPTVFGLIFYYMTFKKVNAEDMPVKAMLVRVLPVSILGFFLVNGTIKNILRIVWFYVLRLVT